MIRPSMDSQPVNLKNEDEIRMKGESDCRSLIRKRERKRERERWPNN